MQPGTFFDRKNTTAQGYVRQERLDCGYTALGIDRDTAFELLTEKKPGVPSMLASLLQESLLTPDFHAFLVTNQGYPLSYEDMKRNVRRLAHEDIQTAYIEYDLSRRAINPDYADPEVLEAVARIQEKALYIWRFESDGSEALIPYTEGKGSLPAIGVERIDLLYLNDGHFEQLDLDSYESRLPGQRIMPLDFSPIAETEADAEENEDPDVDNGYPPPAPPPHKPVNNLRIASSINHTF